MPKLPPSSQRKGYPDDLSIRKRLAANLRRLRRLRGISVGDLARSAGMSPATLSGIERATGNPTLDTLGLLADAFGVQFNDLIEGSASDAITVVPSGHGGRWKRGNMELRFIHRFKVGTAEDVEFFEMVAMNEGPHISQGHGGVENILVLEGMLKLGPIDRSVNVGPGDFISYTADTTHIYETVDCSTARALLALQHPSGVSTAGSVGDSVVLSLMDLEQQDGE